MHCTDRHDEHVAAYFVTDAPANNGWHDNKTSVKFTFWTVATDVSHHPFRVCRVNLWMQMQ